MLVITVARKPLNGTVADNAFEHGTGGICIDRSRIEVFDEDYAKNCAGDRGHAGNRNRQMSFAMGSGRFHGSGRWPPNVVLTHNAAQELDRQTGILTSGSVSEGHMKNSSAQASDGGFSGKFGDIPLTGYGDSGGASRFFKVVGDLK